MSSTVESMMEQRQEALEQRRAALRVANGVRLARARVRRDLATGRVSIREVLLDPPECLETAKVLDLLMMAPRYGRARALMVLAAVRVSAVRRVGWLTGRERRLLADEIARREGQ